MAPPSSLVQRHQKRKKIIIISAVVIALAAEKYARQFLVRQPYHTSALSGQAWVTELLGGHHDRMKDNLGVSAAVFRRLLCTLVERTNIRDTHNMTAEERLAIFLCTAVSGLSMRKVAERFQRSTDTISRQGTFQLVLCHSIYAR
jgi:hypothetical protein